MSGCVSFFALQLFLKGFSRTKQFPKKKTQKSRKKIIDRENERVRGGGKLVHTTSCRITLWPLYRIQIYKLIKIAFSRKAAHKGDHLMALRIIFSSFLLLLAIAGVCTHTRALCQHYMTTMWLVCVCVCVSLWIEWDLAPGEKNKHQKAWGKYCRVINIEWGAECGIRWNLLAAKLKRFFCEMKKIE